MAGSVGSKQVLHSKATDILKTEDTVKLQDGTVRGVAVFSFRCQVKTPMTLPQPPL